jgi:hypothetical protein
MFGARIMRARAKRRKRGLRASLTVNSNFWYDIAASWFIHFRIKEVK